MKTQHTIQFNSFSNEMEWAQASANRIAELLRNSPHVEQPYARLLLSGGNTPALVYRLLSSIALRWEYIDVGLVDERLLPAGDEHTNTKLVEQNLLINAACAAHFESILAETPNLQTSVGIANGYAENKPTVAVLGMGDDGHTASIFPHMPELDQVLHSTEAYAGIDATDIPGARGWPYRITLTPAGLAQAQHRVLLLRGESKRELFETALQGTDISALPIRLLFTLPGAPLEVFWCP